MFRKFPVTSLGVSLYKSSLDLSMHTCWLPPYSVESHDLRRRWYLSLLAAAVTARLFNLQLDSMQQRGYIVREIVGARESKPLETVRSWCTTQKRRHYAKLWTSPSRHLGRAIYNRILPRNRAFGRIVNGTESE